MSTLGAALQRTQPLAPGRALTDSYLLAGRYVRRLLRTPQLVVFQTVQPVMFMLLFVYVFGGAIHTQLQYVDYLIPGVLVQATLFGGGTTTVGLAQDLSEGMFVVGTKAEEAKTSGKVGTKAATWAASGSRTSRAIVA